MSLLRVPALLPVLLMALGLAGCLGEPQRLETGGGTADSVSIQRAPTEAEANSQALVCWRVEGRGNVAHVAVHWDHQSRPSVSRHEDYRGGTMYPDNRSAPAQGGYDLPRGFCADVPVGEQDVYLRAHAIDAAGPPGRFSEERKITVQRAAGFVLAVQLGEVPARAPAGSRVTVCWEVQGNGTIPRTSLLTDNASHQLSVNFEDYRGATLHPDNRTVPDPRGYALPGTFCTGVMVPENNTMYLRAHAMAQPPGVLSAEERSITPEGAEQPMGLAAAVTFAGDVTGSAPAGSSVTVCWSVSGAGRVPETTVRTDTESHAAEPAATGASYDGPAYFPDNATARDPRGYALPGTFCTGVVVPENGTVYLRAHAVDSTGGPGLLSPDERSITSQGGGVPAGLATRIGFSGTLPGSAAAGSSVTVCWSVEGSGRVPETSIRTDRASHAGPDATAASYAGGAYYPSSTAAPDPSGYMLPNTFCTNVQVPGTPGEAIYLRPHILDRDGPPGKLGPEERSVRAT